MATRKIIDAKHNGEKVWLKGHAQATYMSNGSTVEDAINSIQGSSGEAGPETDPVFSASPAASITEANKQAWSNKQDAISDLTNIRNGAAKGATAVQPSSLATVATSGSYTDLSNKPTIPSAVTESTVSGWGFTKNTGTYSKPSGGIPKSDLASAVQTSLGKADTALQKGMVGTLNIIEVEGVYDGEYVYALPTAAAKNVDENYDDIILSRGSVKTINGKSIVGSGNIEISGGTITGVSANGTSIATSGVANIPAASTSAYGVTKLSSATNSTSTTLAATPSAVKAAYDLANSYKGTVTGVKINGSTKSPSSGTVDIGTVATSVKIDNVSKTPSSGVVDLGYANKKLTTSTSSSMTLSPNIYYRNTSTSLSSLTITLGSVSNSNIINEYFVEFTTRSSGTSVSLPSGIKWMNGATPTFEAGTTYQISIVNNLGTWVKFK